MTSHQPRYDRLIISLGDDELEEFVRQWALQKGEYRDLRAMTNADNPNRNGAPWRGRDETSAIN